MTASLNSSNDLFDQNTSDVSHLRQNHPHLKPLDSPKELNHLYLASPEGRLQIHTAPYRGSFSIVLSEALRSAGLGSRVMVADFLKGGVNQGPQGKVELCGQLQWLRPAITHCISKPAQEESASESGGNSQDAVEEIWNICDDHLREGDLDQLVLNEIGLAIELGYLKETEVLATLEQRRDGMDVIITGPSIPSRLMAIADQLTELRCGF